MLVNTKQPNFNRNALSGVKEDLGRCSRFYRAQDKAEVVSEETKEASSPLLSPSNRNQILKIMSLYTPYRQQRYSRVEAANATQTIDERFSRKVPPRCVSNILGSRRKRYGQSKIRSDFVENSPFLDLKNLQNCDNQNAARASAESPTKLIRKLLKSEDFTANVENEKSRCNRVKNLEKLISDKEIAEIRDQIWKQIHAPSHV